MTTATQTESRPAPQSSVRTRRWLRALHAEWRKLSPNLASEPLEGETPAQAERRVRLAWTNQTLKGRSQKSGVRSRNETRVRSLESRVSCPESRIPISSWSHLTIGEAKYLLRKMREESGSNAAWRALKLAEIAAELFGPDWQGILRERLVQRFRVPSPESLAPNEAHAEIEELLSRIARRDGADIETMRRRFFGKKSEVRSQESESGQSTIGNHQSAIRDSAGESRQ